MSEEYVMPGLTCLCGRHLKVPESAVGQAGSCPFCSARLRLIALGVEPSEARFQGRLVIESGPGRVGEQVFIGGCGPIEIGKLPDRTIVLPGTRVSRSHCRLVRVGDDWRIEDLGSRNGLFVNNRRVSIQALDSGDQIQIGEYLLRYTAQAEEEPVPANSAPEASVSRFVMPAPPDAALLENNLYRLKPVEEPAPPAKTAVTPPPSSTDAATRECPSCRASLPQSARICVGCGIDLKTGKPILTAGDADLDAIYTRAESIIRVISWILVIGVYPIASEAFGTRKPWFTRAVAVLTVVTSVWFGWYMLIDSPRMMRLKNYILWSGEAKPTPRQIHDGYGYTSFGDSDTFFGRVEELLSYYRERPARQQIEAAWVQAHEELPPSRQCFGRFRDTQLLTYAFLHGGPIHLVSNLLFLLVFGSRVNALVGNLPMLFFYPLLAVLAGLAHHGAMEPEAPAAMLGASGAVMGLAGMYFVLMPMHKVHMAFWYRWSLFPRFFHLTLRLFAVRGFWVVLFYIAFDVAYMSFGLRDNVAHWAHVGGFICGMVLAFALLVMRAVNCRGGDLLTALLGPRAWPIIGRPDSTRPSWIASVV